MPDNTTQGGWEKLFDHFHIKEVLDDKGIFLITADNIKKYAGREPRLMTKFDTRESRPEILQNTNVTILPVQNGKYALLKCDGYFDFENLDFIGQYQPQNISEAITIPWNSEFSSESQVLDAAHIASLLRTFTGEQELFLTIRGRLRSPDFKFSIKDRNMLRHNLSISGVQIEVDGGYEGKQIYLIEAKIGVRSNFIVRQLYYPFRMWDGVGEKQAVPILLTYSNKVFSLRQYAFGSTGRYDSISLVLAKDYAFSDIEEPPDISKVFDSSSPTPPRQNIPFPQADDLGKVIDLTDAVFSGITGKTELADRFEFEPRQADYYGNASAYLGLIDKTDSGFKANLTTKNFVSKSRNGRLKDITRRISGQKVFREALRNAITGNRLSKERVSELILENIPSVTTEVTAKRRATTVESWINWLLKESRRMV